MNTPFEANLLYNQMEWCISKLKAISCVPKVMAKDICCLFKNGKNNKISY